MTSKLISKLKSHLVANNLEILVSNVIQEVQVLLQIGCMYKRAWYARKFVVGRRPHSYTVQPTIMANGKNYTLHCFHALAVCKDNGTRPDDYMLDIYSQETYRRTYQSNFYLFGFEDFWRDAPYNLIFYPPNMNNRQGRK
ncbi:hypothetical protein M9H77_12193 [Catharanthus roseus]|uniref:Uncharacterized protein n=1 Tax=Catharanthus roseus TaxID=4058 RepID=A0ACC0BGT8_CATRO|nr:hypothetical protein M9H77_12193 [Catharanthus roseus]